MGHLSDIQRIIINQWCRDRVEIDNIPTWIYHGDDTHMKPTSVKFRYGRNVNIEIEINEEGAPNAIISTPVTRDEGDLQNCTVDSWKYIYQPLFRYVWHYLNKNS